MADECVTRTARMSQPLGWMGCRQGASHKADITLPSLLRGVISLNNLIILVSVVRLGAICCNVPLLLPPPAQPGRSRQGLQTPLLDGSASPGCAVVLSAA